MAQVLQLLLEVTVFLTAFEVVVNGNEVCYRHYGCFSDSAPWISSFIQLKLPLCPERIRTSLKIYANKDGFRNGKELALIRPADLPDTGNVVILIHGVNERGHTDEVYTTLQPTLLKKRNAGGRATLNVITVDWSEGARSATPNALGQVIGNARLVAAQIAYLLKQWISRGDLICDNVHLIGWSLGGSIAGLVGKSTQSWGAHRCTIARITGLDPVFAEYTLEFFNMDSATKLQESDAEFVDVIHSHTRFSTVGSGDLRVGKVDFYLNDGYRQPGCPIPRQSSHQSIYCSHFRAVQVFNDTILPIQEHCCKARECTSYDNLNQCQNNPTRRMGFDYGTGSAGRFYLETTSATPFCDDPCDGSKSH